jgi:N-acetylglucosamine kinase-like BadF-type ATPase
MILIADSGSTKTDWTLVHSTHPLLGSQVIATFHTQGITPIHQTSADIRRILEQELLSSISIFPRAQLINSGILEDSLLQKLDIFFYGSGCTPAHVPMMKQLLAEVLTPRSVEVHSDLMAAARALCNHEEGIACILGTGANSCLYDGGQIVQNTPALGYILGDEGSGAVLGRLFLNAIFKRSELADVRDQFLKERKFTQADVIQKVYREPMANRFLATTSLFIHDHLDHPLLRQLVVDNFRSFFRCNIVPYGRPDLPVHFVGSMAHHYPDELQEAAKAEGFTVGKTVQSPLEGLITYHQYNMAK